MQLELTPANGITLNGFKFMALQANDTEVIGRKGVSATGRSAGP